MIKAKKEVRREIIFLFTICFLATLFVQVGSQPCNSFINAINVGSGFNFVSSQEELNQINCSISKFINVSNNYDYGNFPIFISKKRDNLYTQKQVNPVALNLIKSILEFNSQEILSGNFSQKNWNLNLNSQLEQRLPDSISDLYKQLTDDQKLILNEFLLGQGALILPQKDGHLSLGFSRKKPFPNPLNTPNMLVQASFPNDILTGLDLRDESGKLLSLQEVVSRPWSTGSSPTNQMIITNDEFNDKAIIQIFVSESQANRFFIVNKSDLTKSKTWLKIKKESLNLLNIKKNAIIITQNPDIILAFHQAFPDIYLMPWLNKKNNFLKNLDILANMQTLRKDDTDIFLGLPKTPEEVINVFGEKRGDPNIWASLHYNFKNIAEKNQFFIQEKLGNLTKASQVMLSLENPTKNAIIIVGHCTGDKIIFEDGSFIQAEDFKNVANQKFYEHQKIVILFTCHGQYFLKNYPGPHASPFTFLKAGEEETLTLFDKLLNSCKTNKNMFDVFLTSFRGSNIFPSLSKYLTEKFNMIFAYFSIVQKEKFYVN